MKRNGLDRPAMPQAPPEATEPDEGALFRASLASSEILSYLTAGQRERLLEVGEIRRLEVGEAVFYSGEPATRVYCVLTGSVEVETSGSSLVLSRLRAGEMFGEIGVIEGRTRTATVRASEPCALLAIDQADFLEMLLSYPAIGMRLLATLARRLHCLTDFVGGCCETGAQARVA
jgi:CRP-like cAMP-binding protein